MPTINRKELVQLARVGALNWLSGVENRRDALWQVEEASRDAGPLLRNTRVIEGKNPLRSMDTEERLVADYAGAGLTTEAASDELPEGKIA